MRGSDPGVGLCSERRSWRPRGGREPRAGGRTRWIGPNRTEDTRPPQVDFESDSAWTVECQDAVATFERLAQQQLWGQYVGRLVYRADGPRPTVVVRPAQPLPLPADFDCVNCWVYGNNWAWAPDRSTPPVNLQLLFRAATGDTVTVPLGTVRWKEWWLMHQRLHAAATGRPGPERRVDGPRDHRRPESR